MSESKKKIIYVWKSPYPWDVRVQKICESLAKKYDVMILARWGGEEAEEEIINNITIRRVGYKKSSFLSTPLSINPNWKKAIKKAVKDFSADLLIVREIMLGTAAGKTGKKFNIPVIMDMAENYPAVMKGWDKYTNNGLKRFFTNKLKLPDKIERNSVKLMSGILVVCEENKNRVVDQFNYKLERIEVIHNTPGLNWFSKKDIAKNKDIKFAYHGHINTERNLYKFMDAFNEAYNIRKNIKLDIFGSGPELKSLKEYKSKNQLTNNIQIHGHYDHKDLDEIYKSSSIGILPYKINEHINNTISNKLFDYMANGISALTSNAIPMKRVIDETDSGYYVDCNNKSEIVDFILNIENDELAKKGENGYKAFKEKYNWEVDEKNLFDFISGYLK